MSIVDTDFAALRCLALAFSALSLLVHGVARADESGGAPVWTFAGYGSAGLVHSSERQADYSITTLSAGDAGFSHRVSPNVDSRLGAQLAVSIDSHWSATVQVTSERNESHSYHPEVNWANIAYQMTPDLRVRLGRISLPLFLAGDYRKASYALVWLRAPVEVYGTFALSGSDGIDASYSWKAQGLNNVTQVFFGNVAVKVNGNGDYAYERQIAGLSNTTTRGALTVRASAVTSNQSVALVKPLFDAFRQFGPQGAALADTYDIDHKRFIVAILGASYDPGNWFAMSEASRYKTHSVAGDKFAYYVTAGWRWGDVAPYLSYAKVRATSPNHDDGLNLAALPAQAAPAAAYLNGVLNSLLSQTATQHSVSAGVRWDFLPNYAVKVQYDRLLPQGGSSGTLVNVQPGFVSSHPVHVVSAVLDFVF